MTVKGKIVTGVSAGHVALDARRIRLSVFFDSYHDNHHVEFSLDSDNRVSVSHKLRQLADLVDAGADSQEFEQYHASYKNQEERTQADVVEYLRQRLTATEHDTELLKKQAAHRRHQIAGNIRTEVARMRWALAHLPDPENVT